MMGRLLITAGNSQMMCGSFQLVSGKTEPSSAAIFANSATAFSFADYSRFPLTSCLVTTAGASGWR